MKARELLIGTFASLALIAAPAAFATSGGTSGGGGGGGNTPGEPCTSPGNNFVLITTNTSKKACSPASAPQRVKDAVQQANTIRNKPYCWGGGHGGWSEDNCYDCSGSVSYALHGGGWLSSPLDSSGFMHWGEGQATANHEWIKVYANSGHVWMKVKNPDGTDNGIRWDTSGGGDGPSWRNELSSSSGYRIRHPKSYS